MASDGLSADRCAALAEVGRLLLHVHERIQKKKSPSRGSDLGDGTPPEACSDGIKKIPQ